MGLRSGIKIPRLVKGPEFVLPLNIILLFSHEVNCGAVNIACYAFIRTSKYILNYYQYS